MKSTQSTAWHQNFRKKRMDKQEIYAQRAQTSADPDDPDFGLWTPGSEA